MDIKGSFVIRTKEDDRLVKKCVKFKSHKADTLKEAGGEFANLTGKD